MPQKGQYQMSIVVGEETLQEYLHEGKVFVESDFHTPESYILEEEEDGVVQQYPVTPYSIHVRHLMEEAVYVSVYADGHQIRSRPWFPCKRPMVTDAIKIGQELRELTFTLPRMLEDQEKMKENVELGTIKVVFYEAIPGKAEYMNSTRVIHVNIKNNIPESAGRYHATKKECSQGPQGMIGATTRDGRIQGKLQQNSQHKYLRVRYRIGKVIESLTVNYRPRYVMEELGILLRNPGKRTESKQSNKSNKKEIDSQEMCVDDSNNKPCPKSGLNTPGKLNSEKENKLNGDQSDSQEMCNDGLNDTPHLKQKMNTPLSPKSSTSVMRNKEIDPHSSSSLKMQVNSPSQSLISSENSENKNSLTNDIPVLKNEMVDDYIILDDDMDDDDYEKYSAMDDSIILVGEYIPIKRANIFHRTPGRIKKEVKHDLDDSVICLGECPLEDLLEMDLTHPVKQEMDGDNPCFTFDLRRVKKEPNAEDESIIFLGDDSCYEFDVTPMEIPEIDLTDE